MGEYTVKKWSKHNMYYDNQVPSALPFCAFLSIKMYLSENVHILKNNQIPSELINLIISNES